MKRITEKIFLTPKQQQEVIKYCDNAMKELKKICDPIIFKKSIPGMYHDDLYDIALDVLLVSVTQYDDDKGASFETYLTGNIRKAFSDWKRDNLRSKRCNVARDSNNGKIIKSDGRPVVIPDIRLNERMEDGTEIGEMIDSGFRIEDELSGENGFEIENNIQEYSPVVQDYLRKLSRVQIKVLELICQGYSREEIQEILHITRELYEDSIMAITSKKATRKIEKLYRGI